MTNENVTRAIALRTTDEITPHRPTLQLETIASAAMAIQRSNTKEKKKTKKEQQSHYVPQMK
jgi:hypothetical protein